MGCPFGRPAAALKDVRADHRRFDVFVAQQLLQRSDVAMVFQQACGEEVAECAAGDALVKVGAAARAGAGFLLGALVLAMTPRLAGTRVPGESFGWEDVWSDPSAAGVGKLPVQLTSPRLPQSMIDARLRDGNSPYTPFKQN